MEAITTEKDFKLMVGAQEVLNLHLDQDLLEKSDTPNQVNVKVKIVAVNGEKGVEDKVMKNQTLVIRHDDVSLGVSIDHDGIERQFYLAFHTKDDKFKPEETTLLSASIGGMVKLYIDKQSLVIETKSNVNVKDLKDQPIAWMKPPLFGHTLATNGAKRNKIKLTDGLKTLKLEFDSKTYIIQIGSRLASDASK